MTVRGYNLSWDSSNRSDTLLQSIKVNRDSYTDVKLVTEDGQMFRAHKLILASSSTYFHDLFQMSANFDDIGQNSHILVALPDVQGNSLASVLSFIYDGHTQVLATDIDLFTKTAKRFKVKGLTADENKTNDSLEQENVQEDNIKDEPQDIEEFVLEENHDITEEKLTPETDATSSDKIVRPVKKSRKSMESPELTETVIIEKGDLKCPSCNYETKQYNSLKIHAAYKHKQRVQFKCNKCEQVFEESNSMISHHKKEHVVIKAPKKQSYNCHLCSYKSLKEENLERHVKFTLHENEGSVNPSVNSSVKEQEQSVDLDLD